MRTILIALLCLTSGSALAQEAQAPAPASAPAEATHPAAIKMGEPRAGDYWTFEIKDEISGKVTDTRTDTITDVTPTQIAVSYSNPKKGTGFYVFDHSWNMKTSDKMKYTPHNGLGIVQPLKVGALWDFKVEQVNTENAAAWKWSGRSKVGGQEQITTKAGTFDTFKIETKYTFYPVKNPGRKSETTIETWYAPSIDHWVRRSIVARTDNLLRANHVIDVVAYGRKE